MPTEGTLKITADGRWHIFIGFQWQLIDSTQHLAILGQFDGVSGESPNQVFSLRGGDSTMTSQEVLKLMGSGGQSVKTVSLAAEWKRLGFTGPWPPIEAFTKDIDSATINTFLRALEREERLAQETDGEPRLYDLSEIPGGGIFVQFPGSAAPIRLDPPQISGDGQLTTMAIPGTNDVLVITPDGTNVIRPAAEVPGIEAPVQQATVETIDGRQFIRQPNGTLTLLPPAQNEPGQGEIITQDGRQFIRQPDGRLTLLPPVAEPAEPPERTIQQMITRFLANGEAEAAIALSEFRDQPSSLELMAAAEKFAQSPGEQVAISAIARGHTLVSPPPVGEVQRIADPPEFLLTALQKLRRMMFGGQASAGDFDAVIGGAERRIKESEKAREAAEDEVAGMKQTQFDNQLKDLLAGVGKHAGETLASTNFEDISTSTRAKAFEILGTPFAPWGSDVANRLAASIGLTEAQAQAEKARFEDAQAEGDAFKRLFGSGTNGSTGGSGGGQDQSTFGTLEPTVATREAQDVQVAADPNLSVADTFNAAGGRDFTLDVTSGLGAASETTFVTKNPSFPGLQFRDTSFNPDAADAFIQDQSEEFTSELTAQELEDEGDFFAGGGVFDDRTAIVGEDGPELVQLPVGTTVLSNTDSREIDSLDELMSLFRITKKRKKKSGKKTLREVFGMQELAHGGTVESLLPIGVRQAIRGRPIEPTRRRLSTAAGLPVLSAQAQQNLLPEELDVFDRLRAEAGIPLGAFLQEQQSALPGVLRRRPSRFAPRVAR